MGDAETLGLLGVLAAEKGHGVQAREWLRRALEKGEGHRVLLERYADAMLSLGDAGAAVRVLRGLIEEEPADRLQLKLGMALNGAQRFDEAEQLFRALAHENSPVRQDAMHGLAETLYLDRRFHESAVVAREAARMAPNPVPLLQLLARALSRLPLEPDEAMALYDDMTDGAYGGDEVLHDAMKAEPRGEDLDLALRQARFEAAADPDDVHALRSLAHVHGARFEYGQAVELYDRLLDVFPEHTGLMIDRARTLAWSGDFAAATGQYAQVATLEPDNPLPHLETARTLLWGKEFKPGMLAYERLWAAPVDGMLPDVCEHYAKQLEEQQRRGRGVFRRRVPPYALSECFIEQVGVQEAARRGVYAPWRIQKKAWLEAQSKRRLWRQHYLRALDSLEDLVAFAPGNLEAWFDLGQAADALDLRDRAIQAYEHILLIDPAHNRARIALEKQELLLEPGLHGHYRYWRESGRDDVSGIRRHEGGWQARMPLSERARVAVGSAGVSENPDTHATRKAWTLDVSAETVMNAYWRARASYRHKSYESLGFADGHTGQLESEWNVQDWVQLALRAERRETIQNYYGMAQGIHADVVGVSLLSPLTRRVQVHTRGESIQYSDDNEGWWLWGRLGTQLTDHPRVVQVYLYGELRDTRREGNLPQLEPRAPVADVLHPYWTPQDYYGYGVGFEWYHDLAREYFRGYDAHYYDVQVILSDDSEGNPGIKLQVDWFMEWRMRWIVGLHAEMTRSRQWDADGIWVQGGWRL